MFTNMCDGLSKHGITADDVARAAIRMLLLDYNAMILYFLGIMCLFDIGLMVTRSLIWKLSFNNVLRMSCCTCLCSTAMTSFACTGCSGLFDRPCLKCNA